MSTQYIFFNIPFPKILSIFAFAMVVIFCPVAPFGDGEVLKRHTVAHGQQINSWVYDFYGYVQRKYAQIQLGSGQKIDAHPFRIGLAQNQAIHITSRQPYRLFWDGNKDGRYQAKEIYQAKHADFDTNIFVFQNVNIYANIGKENLPILADIYISIRAGRIFIRSIRSRHYFDGSLTIEGEEYPARMVIVNPFFHLNQSPITPIILDTNRDGEFNPFIDPWVSSHEVGYVNNKLYQVSTNGVQNGIQVDISPIQEPGGTLVLENPAVYRMYIEKENNSVFSIPNPFLCLPYRADHAYRLPAGRYSIRKLWMGSPDSQSFIALSSNYYTDDKNQILDVTIRESETTSLSLAKGLNASLKVSSTWFFPSLRFNSLKDRQGNSFHFVKKEDIGRAKQDELLSRPPAPFWEVRDESGRLVAQGQFEYG
ncbi:hypothetical protein GF373_00450 [bacterium]|nr:hypothetical protein [bacterium]